MSEQLNFTAHALKRMAQRNLSKSDISFILKHGCEKHGSGVLFISCRLKDIPKKWWNSNHIRRLEGVTIVMNRTEPTIITVWRNRNDGQRHIRKKPKYRF